MSDVYTHNEEYKLSGDYNSKTPYDEKYSNTSGNMTSYNVTNNGTTRIDGNAIYRTNFETSRMSRTGDELTSDENIVYSEVMNPNLLSRFLTSSSQKNLNSYNSVLSLGSIITRDMYDNITERSISSNEDLGNIDVDELRDSMVFRNYTKTGNSNTSATSEGGDISSINEGSDPDDNNTVTLNDSGSGGDVSRNTVNLGLSLGEALVLNPMHQFNKRDDPRTSPLYANIGRTYAEAIMSKWPIVLIQPGRLKYNNSFFTLLGTGAGATEAFIRSGGEGLAGVFSSIGMAVSDAANVVGSVGAGLFGGNKMVEFKQNYNFFKQYASHLYTILAADMGLLEGSRYVGKYKELSLDHILPGQNLAGRMGQNWRNNQFLPFRCGKGITSGESFSNSMNSNPLADSMNSTSEEEDGKSANQSIVGRFLSGDNVGDVVKSTLNKVAGKFSDQAHILSGKSRINLPDVWANSSFSRNFSFNFKFHSPYGDDLSIFENCYIPFLTLLATTLSRQTGKMSYTSPFAVRISVKNLVMINFGMVESLSVTRGGDINDWTPSGYPKTLSVDLNIKDMEPNITLPLGSRGPFKAFLETMFPSSGISEYMASLGGLSLRDVYTLGGKWKRAKSVFLSTWNATLDWDNIMSRVSNSSTISNIASIFSTTDLDTLTLSADPRLANDNAKMSQAYTPGKNVYANWYQDAVQYGGEYTQVLDKEKADLESAASEIITDLGANTSSNGTTTYNTNNGIPTTY